jgi:hypothetical protein
MKMKRQLVILSLALAAVSLARTASANPPKQPITSPENHLLAVWYGDWTYTTETFDTPLSEKSTVTGTLTGHSILNGWGSEFIYHESGVRYMEVDYWDPTAVVPDIYAHDYPFGAIRDTTAPGFTYIFLSDDGYTELGMYSMDGKTCTFSNSFVQDGINYTLWGDEILSKDGLINTRHYYLSWSKDGHKYTLPYSSTKYLKVKPACPK